ncbi:guanylate kinase [Terrihabitans soli]|uniref:Guanylate kinase n=1 Tax=Terrihabitans soli TaxID=708113 RepID=A0A6S6QUS9_9HYPH|nr:guanylate kinase [Terrihabitans soli]BCJ90851.1 guanylate kinase [Terrihabitans soli]
MSASSKIVDRGFMLVVSSPSGAGKTTLTRNLLQEEKDDVVMSVSVTTRQKRPSEIEGVHYNFITQKRFDQMRDNGDLLEHAKVHDHYYGTPREPVDAALAAGKDVLFDIDWQGTRQLKESVLAPDVVTVFVLPPSAAELKARLERRAEDPADVIARRLRNAAEEIPHWNEYDYVLVNSDLDKSFMRLRSILQTERLKRVQNVQTLVDQLVADLAKLTG